jgi:Cof subfamily protein (haloacid dehalogenase superfamily)
MSDIGIIFFDIDGTIVSFKTKTVSQSTKDAINGLKQRGIKVIIATGRAFYDVNLEDLTFDGYITSNGAYCIDTKDTVIAKHTMSAESLSKLKTFLHENPIPCSFMTPSGNMINFINDAVRYMYGHVNIPLPVVKPISEIIKHDVFQLTIFANALEESKIMQCLPECSSSRWHPTFIDLNVNCCKASGIDAFLEYYNLKIENTMAFGDGGNDVSMLKHVQIGVAMDNATEDAKAAADYITASVDDDGVAKALKYFGYI